MLTRLAPRRPPSRSTEAAQFVAFCIVDRGDSTTSWIRCGRARLNRDGSLNVRLDALPLNGELHLRPVDTSGAGASPRPSQPATSPEPTPHLHS